jgi:hypothetical protein
MTARRIALALALVIVVGFGVLEASGAREHAGSLSGTLPGDDVALALGLAYVIGWFAAILVAPILVLAVILDVVCGTLSARWRASRRPCSR